MNLTRKHATSWVAALCVALGIPGALSTAVAAATHTPGRIVVVGATAKSSKEIIRQALAAGYQVVAVARKPEEVPVTDPKLTVLKGDVYEPASLEAAIRPGDVVISMVGPRVAPMQEVPASFDLYSTGTDNIIAAMKKNGSKRLLVASSLGVENQREVPAEKPQDMSKPSTMWLWNSRYLYRNMAAMEQHVRRSGLEYVIFRPPFLVEEPARQDYKVSINVDSPKGMMMTYADFGALVLGQVSGAEYLDQTVGVFTDRQLKFGENADFEKLAREAIERAKKEKPREK